MVEVSATLSERGVLAELPMPDYGYVRIGMILLGEMDEDMINDWAEGHLGDLTYTDNHGMNTGARTPICQIPIKGWVCLSTSHEIPERNQTERRSAGEAIRTTGRQDGITKRHSQKHQ